LRYLGAARRNADGIGYDEEKRKWHLLLRLIQAL